jgi:hypothetical protein
LRLQQLVSRVAEPVVHSIITFFGPNCYTIANGLCMSLFNLVAVASEREREISVTFDPWIAETLHRCDKNERVLVLV